MFDSATAQPKTLVPNPIQLREVIPPRLWERPSPRATCRRPARGTNGRPEWRQPDRRCARGPTGPAEQDWRSPHEWNHVARLPGPLPRRHLTPWPRPDHRSSNRFRPTSAGPGAQWTHRPSRPNPPNPRYRRWPRPATMREPHPRPERPPANPPGPHTARSRGPRSLEASCDCIRFDEFRWARSIPRPQLHPCPSPSLMTRRIRRPKISLPDAAREANSNTQMSGNPDIASGAVGRGAVTSGIRRLICGQGSTPQRLRSGVQAQRGQPSTATKDLQGRRFRPTLEDPSAGLAGRRGGGDDPDRLGTVGNSIPTDQVTSQ